MNRFLLIGIACSLIACIGCIRERLNLRDVRYEANQTRMQSFPEDDLAHRTEVSTEPENGHRMVVVAYNTHLLPSIATPIAGHRGNSKYRASEIATRLASYDLIGLSELFDSAHRQRALDTFQSEAAGQFHLVEGPKRSGRHLVGSGLVLLSRYPIVETNEITFKNASRFITSGFKADGFAAKGALHAKVLVDEQAMLTVDCFLTHLESHSISVRALQLQELKTFIVNHTDARSPSLIMGDFNVTDDSSRTAELKTEFEQVLVSVTRADGGEVLDVGKLVSSGPRGTSNALATDGGRRIDYIFVVNGVASSSHALSLCNVEHASFLDSDVPEGSLSDHLAVVCELELVRHSR